jgi:opacity protein-like surface antigen
MKASVSAGLIALFLAALFPSTAAAQHDYFRALGSPRQISQVQPLQPDEEEKYNLMIGPIRFSAAAGVGLEWNDNITLSDNDRQSDFIFRPSLNIDSNWQITELNTLRFSIGASYAKYFKHSEFDSRSVLLSPNTELAFTVHVGQVAITLRDRFSYQEDPYDLPVLSDVANYRRFENLASIQADWQATESLKISTGYSHYNFWSRDDEFSQLDRAIDTVYVRPSLQLTPAIEVGVNGSVSWVRFKEDVQNDGQNYMIGPFATIAFSESLSLYVEGGLQRFNFDDGGAILDTDDSSTWYLKSILNHKLSDYFVHRVAFSKTTEVGFNTNYYELYHAEYAADWKLTPSFSVDPTAFYEHYETSGVSPEEANRYGAAVGLRYVLTPSITMGADYRFILKDSNIEDADYRQNMVLLSLYYNF